MEYFNFNLASIKVSCLEVEDVWDVFACDQKIAELNEIYPFSEYLHSFIDKEVPAPAEHIITFENEEGKDYLKALPHNSSVEIKLRPRIK